jgi:hypothetical protein
MNNNRLIRNNQGRVVRVLETPTGSPRTPRGNQLRRNLLSPPPMSPQQRPRRRQPLARRLNFNNVEITERNFFNQIKTILRPYHPNVEITNNMIRTQLFPEDISNMLGRNLTNQELRWLGAARRGTENNKPKNVNINALMAKYNVSPLKRQRENNATNYYDNTFTPRSPQKVRNKVFLLTEVGSNGKVKKVYDRRALTSLDKKIGPFTQIKFENYHIKNYKNKNRIERELKNFKNLGFNLKNITNAYAKNQMRSFGTFSKQETDIIKKIIRTLKRNNVPRNVKTLLKERLALMIISPNLYRNLGLSRTVYERNLARIINVIPENIRDLF